MRDDSHYRLYMPKKEEESRLLGLLALLLFIAIAFGVIIGSAYLYSYVKHGKKEDSIESIYQMPSNSNLQTFFSPGGNNQKLSTGDRFYHFDLKYWEIVS